MRCKTLEFPLRLPASLITLAALFYFVFLLMFFVLSNKASLVVQVSWFFSRVSLKWKLNCSAQCHNSWGMVQVFVASFLPWERRNDQTLMIIVSSFVESAMSTCPSRSFSSKALRERILINAVCGRKSLLWNKCSFAHLKVKHHRHNELIWAEL